MVELLTLFSLGLDWDRLSLFSMNIFFVFSPEASEFHFFQFSSKNMFKERGREGIWCVIESVCEREWKCVWVWERKREWDGACVCVKEIERVSQNSRTFCRNKFWQSQTFWDLLISFGFFFIRTKLEIELMRIWVMTSVRVSLSYIHFEDQNTVRY